MANPKLKEGYTPIANELLEKVYKLKLNGTQFKIILVVFRFTYGFSRQHYELSESFISKATDTNKKQISRELTSLIKLNVIKVIKEASFNNSRIISFNKNYDTWLLKDEQGANQLPPNELEGGTGSELVTLPGSGLAPQDKQSLKQYLKQKDTEAKLNKKVYYLDEKLNDTILDFIDFRKKIKSPMTDHAIDILINKLDKMTSVNADKIEILNQSIMNGWKGIFPLKGDYERKEGKTNGTQYSNGYGEVLTGAELMEQCRIEAEARGETWEIPNIDGPFK